MASTQEIILEYVCPAVGVVLAIIMFLAPVKDLKSAIDKGELGTLNPTPWGFMLGNCVGWLIYGLLLKNVWVVMGNAPGLLISIWLNLGAIKLVYLGHHRAIGKRDATVLSSFLEKAQPLGEGEGDVESQASGETKATDILQASPQSTTAPTRHENVVMLMCAIWTVIGTVLGMVDSMSLESKVFLVGIVTNGILITFYGAPLSTIAQVLKEKSTASIHVPTMFLNTITSGFWCVYGVAINDYFIIGPNALGFVCGAIQIVLYMAFPRSPKAPSQGATERNDSDLSLPSLPGIEAQVASSALVKPHLLDVLEEQDGTVAASA